MLPVAHHSSAPSRSAAPPSVDGLRAIGLCRSGPIGAQRPSGLPQRPSPAMYVTIFVVWLASLAWFGPRLLGLFDAADNWIASGLIGYFVLFVAIAWLYGIYNVVVVAFAMITRRSPIRWREHPAAQLPPIAVLYTTRNDFVEASARSCVELDWHNHRVYLLDDSDDPAYRRQVDAFAAAESLLAAAGLRGDGAP